MSAEVLVATITSVVGLFGTIITVLATNSRTNHKLEINQAVTSEKIDNLAMLVNSHTEQTAKIPVIEEQIKVINHRLDAIEKKEK